LLDGSNDGSNVLPALEQMGGEGMTERVAICRFGDAGPPLP